jgi:hypothetical protein
LGFEGVGQFEEGGGCAFASTAVLEGAMGGGVPDLVDPIEEDALPDLAEGLDEGEGPNVGCVDRFAWVFDLQ